MRIINRKNRKNEMNTALENIKIDTYKINSDIVKALKNINVLFPENEYDLMMTEFLSQLNDLIKNKTMSFDNTYLVIYYLEEMMFYYSQLSGYEDMTPYREMTTLYEYFSIYFIVYKRDLDFICRDKKTNRTFYLDFYIE